MQMKYIHPDRFDWGAKVSGTVRDVQIHCETEGEVLIGDEMP